MGLIMYLVTTLNVHSILEIEVTKGTLRTWFLTIGKEKTKDRKSNAPFLQKNTWLSEIELKEQKEKFMTSLCLNKEQHNQLERNTRWKRVTASNFTRSAKRRPITSCKNLVHDLLYGTIKSTQAMLHEQFDKELGLKAAEQATGWEIKKMWNVS
ncbi:hypothetical protein PR048_012803 [Dryococelus australis]|uniref:Uncharacterized protein n=1 Tax=Dryococelus australis TaxID=614101 RepID=A0ABQ9HQF4_9NEOP|nr:hypothetical protein PR048_012803 [Dryococelus australis]